MLAKTRSCKPLLAQTPDETLFTITLLSAESDWATAEVACSVFASAWLVGAVEVGGASLGVGGATGETSVS